MFGRMGAHHYLATTDHSVAIDSNELMAMPHCRLFRHRGTSNGMHSTCILLQGGDTQYPPAKRS